MAEAGRAEQGCKDDGAGDGNEQNQHNTGPVVPISCLDFAVTLIAKHS